MRTHERPTNLLFTGKIDFRFHTKGEELTYQALKELIVHAIEVAEWVRDDGQPANYRFGAMDMTENVPTISARDCKLYKVLVMFDNLPFGKLKAFTNFSIDSANHVRMNAPRVCSEIDTFLGFWIFLGPN